MNVKQKFSLFGDITRKGDLPGQTPYAHRFRHTVAVDLLLAGVPLERVAVLLGHKSLRLTEKYHAPWVHARQGQLEADVKRVWELDLPATKGTPRVRGKTPVVN